MKFRKNNLKIGLLFFISLALISCGKSGAFKSSESKEEYLGKYEKLSLENKKKSISQDLSDLDSLLGLANGFTLYYSISFSAGSVKSDSVKVDIDAADPFQINNNEDSAKVSLAKIIELPTLYQTLQVPEAEIETDIPSEDANGAVIASKITKIFSKGKETTLKKIGLQKADSAYVQVSYKYPSSMQRYEILSSKKDHFTIEKSKIEIEKAEGNQFEFEFPQAMYQRLLGYQALDEDGILMNPNANSAFPVTSVRKSIAAELEKTKAILEKVKVSKTDDDFLAQLKNIPKEVFPHKNRLIDLDKAIEKMKRAEKRNKKGKNDDDDFSKIVEPIKKVMEEFQDILAAEYQQVEMSFPNKVSKIYFYIAQEYNTLSNNVVAVNDDEAQEYSSFFDSKKEKFGIVNSTGKIVLQPSLEKDIYHVEKNIFSDYTSSYLLDAAKGKLTKFADKIFIKSIDKNRMIFQDSLKMVGVLDENQKEIIPFEYKNLDASGNIYVGEKSLRGRKYSQILDKNGKILFERVNNAMVSEHGDGVIIETMEKKIGLLDNNGKLVILPQNDELGFIGKGPLLQYELNIKNEEIKLGLMDAKGKLISAPDFWTIHPEYEDLIVVQRLDSELYEYIKRDGKTAFPGKFLDANDFMGGFAIVETENEKYAVLNKAGKIIFTFPASAGNFREQTVEGKQVIFEFENETFNSKNMFNK